MVTPEPPEDKGKDPFIMRFLTSPYFWRVYWVLLALVVAWNVWKGALR